MNRRVMIGWAAALLLAACGRPEAAKPAEAKPALVYAAASLTDVLKVQADAFAATGKPKPEFSFAASSELARQIEQGAQADVFISADEQWMDYLDSKGMIDKATRVDLLGNSLVLILPSNAITTVRDKPAGTEPTHYLDSAEAKGLLSVLLGTSGKLAMADPDAVPAGKYGKEALTSLGAWADVEAKVAKAANVRDALRLVAMGEAAAGIVYATDAKTEPKVQVISVFPETSHKPIVYPMALMAGPSNGAGFAEFLQGDGAKAVFEKYGFRVLR